MTRSTDKTVQLLKEAATKPLKAQTLVVDVTPELAKAFLANNISNRPLRPLRVATYARDMKEGRWKENGETVVVATSGRLMSGQHRMNAVIQADVTVRMLISFGVDEGAFETLDAGLPRAAHDALGVYGITNNRTVVGVTRIALNYRDEVAISAARSVPELVNAVAEQPTVEEYVRRNIQAIRLGRVAFGAVVFLAEQFGPQDQVLKVKEFVDGVATGAGLGATDPRLQLRNRLTGVGASKGLKLGQPQTWWATAYCLDLFLRGESLKFMRIPSNELFTPLRSVSPALLRESWGKTKHNTAEMMQLPEREESPEEA